MIKELITDDETQIRTEDRKMHRLRSGGLKAKENLAWSEWANVIF